MGYGFDKNGQYDSWVPMNYSNKNILNALEKLPLPNNRVNKPRMKGKDIVIPGILYANKGKMTNSVNLEVEFKEFIDEFLKQENSLESLDLIEDLTNISKLDKKYTAYSSAFNIRSDFSVDAIDKLKNILLKINKENTLTLNLGSDILYNQYADDFIKLINDYNTSKEYLNKKNAINNSVVSRIKRIISSPSNYLIANEPVDVEDWQNVATEGLAFRGGVKRLLSSLDMLSTMQQQKDASVGRDDVGISANGLKVFYSLTSYYNNYYDNPNLVIKDNDYKLFNKKFIMQGKSYNISTLSDVQIRKKQVELLEKHISDGLEKLDIFKSNAAIAMSGFTSLATDNAKELAMSKLNASVELASMHLYMLSIGIDMKTISLFMNSNVAITVAKKLESNLFLDSEETSNYVIKQINQYEKDNGTSSDIDTFRSMYSGAQEFKIISGFLKINQKTSANIKELNKFLTNFETAIFSREHTIFERDLYKLRTFGENSVEVSEIIAKIKANNKTVSTETITRVIKEAVDMGIAGGQFDFREYIKDGNDKYKRVTTEYYNLLKDTINVFDVIETVPHFKAMIDGVKISHNILLKLSKKYNFAFNDLRTIARENADWLTLSNDYIKHQFGNKSFPLRIDDNILSKALLGFDKFLVGNWLKSDNKSKNSPSNISFNVKNLLELADVDSIQLYTENSKLNKNIGIIIDKTADENLIVTLDTDHGIANFKRIMEELILPILKKNDYNPKFVESLTVRSLRTTLGFRMSSIVSAFSMSQLNNPVNLDKFQNLLTDFNDLDLKPKKLKNSQGVDMSWRDLFYIYNLVVNNESYGDLRLTPIFEDYLKEPNTVGNDYLLFSSKVDNNEVDIFDYTDDNKEVLNKEIKTKEEIKDLDRAKKAMINDIIFYAFNKNGSILIKDPMSGSNRILSIQQPDFVVNLSLDPISLDKQRQINIKNIIKYIKENALVITVKCK